VSGYSREDSIGRSSVELGWITAEDREQMIAQLRRDGRVANRELELTAKDGRKVFCLFSAELVSIEGVQRLLSIALDITLRKETENRLHDSEVKFRNLFDSAMDAIFILEVDGRFIDVNAAAYRRLGYTKDELLALPLSQLDPPEFAARIADRLKMVREQGSAIFESAHLRKDGAVMPVEINCMLHEYEGRTVYFSIIRDVTERKRAERLLRESEDRYRRFSSLTSDYVASCRRRGSEPFRIQWLGGAVADITGFSLEEVMRWGCWMPIVHPDDAPRIGRCLQEMKAGEKRVDEFRIIRKDGAIRWIRENSCCEAGSFPDELFRYGTSQDVTRRKEAENAIQRLNEHLERLVEKRTADLARSNEELAGFCYAVSHELRAPIARLQGFCVILGEMCDSDGEMATLIDRIANSSRQLQSVVDSLLALSRLSMVERKSREVNLSEMAEELAQELLAGHRAWPGEVVIAPGIVAVADPDLMRICLDNLIGNALKYTGQIPKARIEFGSFDDSGKEIYFVRDNGAGFDMAYSEKLYAPFQRLHQHKEFPGIGIGLATVKRIIEKHNGEIWAESAVGEGATFYFTLNDQS
jgi:PAS domain S-box-containing protein